MRRRPKMTPYVLNNYIQIPETGCWLWLGWWDRHKYGGISKLNDKYSAHRAFYEHFNGRISDDILVCHKCDTPPCVNPGHMFLGTHLDNMTDAWNKGRFRNRQKRAYA